MKNIILITFFLVVSVNFAHAEIGHDINIDKVEIKISDQSIFDSNSYWKVLSLKIKNPLSVPIILRNIEVMQFSMEKTNAKIERGFNIFGKIIWSDLDFLQLSPEEIFETSDKGFRLITDSTLIPSETLRFNFDFGPMGEKSVFFRVPD
jgi:hypothetical protein|tara:strand:- start:489 stop:935 length:447 start_codon:yes stop_codon:yes gene_type:complete